MEVNVQPDRENAECDDAAVEVAAHLFFASLSRGLCSHNDESWVCNPGFNSLVDNKAELCIVRVSLPQN